MHSSGTESDNELQERFTMRRSSFLNKYQQIMRLPEFLDLCLEIRSQATVHFLPQNEKTA